MSASDYVSVWTLADANALLMPHLYWAIVGGLMIRLAGSILKPRFL